MVPVALVDVGGLPAPTLTSQSGAQWVVSIDPADVVLRMGTHAGATVRRATEPAPTLVMGSRANAVDWFVGDAADEVEEAYRRRAGKKSGDPLDEC